VDVFGASEAAVDIQADHGAAFHVLWPKLAKRGTFTWPPKHRFRAIVNGELV
jgi:hypothetical protein